MPPATRTSNVIRTGVVSCVYEGLVIEDHFGSSQSFKYGMCRLDATENSRSALVRLTGASASGPSEQPFQLGEHLTLRVQRPPLGRPIRRASSASVSHRRALLGELMGTAESDAGPSKPSWEMDGTGAIVTAVLQRRSPRRLSHLGGGGSSSSPVSADGASINPIAGYGSSGGGARPYWDNGGVIPQCSELSVSQRPPRGVSSCQGPRRILTVSL